MNRIAPLLLLFAMIGCKAAPVDVPATTSATVAPTTTPESAPGEHMNHEHHHETLPAAEVTPGSSLYQLDVTMTDQNGKPRTWDDFRGEPVIVSMIYSTCTTACPLIVNEIKQILKQAGTESLPVLLVSMDPERDNPAALLEMKKSHTLGDNWTLVQPGSDDVAEVAAALGVRYRQLPTKDFNHSQVISLLDTSGTIKARAEGLGPQRDAVVEAIGETP